MSELINDIKYYTIMEAARELRRHPLTIWRWTVERIIDFHQPKPGAKILIPHYEITRLQKSINIR
jgi:hypothetical protein